MLDLEALVVERNAHAKRRRRAKITDELHDRLRGHLSTAYTAGVQRATFWSMAPKIDWPARSNISMRMRSPNAMNGVTGLPLSMVSRTRRSAMQEQPAPASRLATVPEPTTVPASR